MESANQNTLVTGQRFEKTVQVRDLESQPDQGLFQPWYPLSEADYLRLRESSSVLATLGGATMTFCISYIAPKLVDYYTLEDGSTGDWRSNCKKSIRKMKGPTREIGDMYLVH